MLLGYPRHILDFKCKVPTRKKPDTKESLKLSEMELENMNYVNLPGSQFDFDSRAVGTGNIGS